ncbi:MAG TPA: ATP-binding protein [Flavobacteriales bacterium]|nr:ATP-binding protein [Flavobacteriales bacterium]
MPHTPSTATSNAGISILLVEDNLADARLVQELLRETDYAGATFQHVCTMHDAQRARRSDGRAMCVLLDLNLPDAEGMVALSRARETYSDSAIVVLTGMDDDRLAITALQQGAQSYLRKEGLDAMELGRVLRQSIERHDFVVRLREADRSIMLRERRFRALVERSNDLTLLLDRDGRVTYMSPAAARTLLLPEVNAEQLDLASLMFEPDAELARACLQQAMADPEKPVPLSARVRPTRGDLEVWVEGTLTDLLNVAGVEAVVANLHDITLRHHAERELLRANLELEGRVEERTRELRIAEEELREALDAERAINDAKTRFISTASHEFRTPLTVIQSSADLITRYNAELGHGRIAQHAVRIREMVRDLIGILENFLSLEKLETGVELCKPEEFDLIELCRSLIEEMQPLAKRGQQVRLEGGVDAISVRLDPRMTANALRNLLSNAMKYSPEERDVKLCCRSNGERVHITVIDQGIGIPLEDQPYLFDRFFRATNAGATQGTGLGLPIIRRYVELMQGSVGFSSQQDQGSTFVIDLPRAIPS